MDPLNQFLIEQWDTSWDGAGWYASWTKALGDLTALQAAWSPGDGRHSIWQNVNHVTFWRSVSLNSAEGKPRPSDDEINRRNFEGPTDISENAWGEAKELLQDSHRAIRPILAGEKPGLDKVKVHLTHDAYHVGQIMQLRAMQGMKSIV